MNTNTDFHTNLQTIYAEIRKAGVGKQTAEFTLAYMGSIEAMQRMSAERLKRGLLKIPTIGEKTANKMVLYFK